MSDYVAIARAAAKAAKRAEPSPMERLLESAVTHGASAVTHGAAEPDNPQHWQTVSKAVRLGLLDLDLRLTQAGRAALDKEHQRRAVTPPQEVT